MYSEHQAQCLKRLAITPLDLKKASRSVSKVNIGKDNQKSELQANVELQAMKVELPISESGRADLSNRWQQVSESFLQDVKCLFPNSKVDNGHLRLDSGLIWSIEDTQQPPSYNTLLAGSGNKYQITSDCPSQLNPESKSAIWQFLIDYLDANSELTFTNQNT